MSKKGEKRCGKGCVRREKKCESEKEKKKVCEKKKGEKKRRRKRKSVKGKK